MLGHALLSACACLVSDCTQTQTVVKRSQRKCSNSNALCSGNEDPRSFHHDRRRNFAPSPMAPAQQPATPPPAAASTDGSVHNTPPQQPLQPERSDAAGDFGTPEASLTGTESIAPSVASPLAGGPSAVHASPLQQHALTGDVAAAATDRDGSSKSALTPLAGPDTPGGILDSCTAGAQLQENTPVNGGHAAQAPAPAAGAAVHGAEKAAHADIDAVFEAVAANGTAAAAQGTATHSTSASEGKSQPLDWAASLTPSEAS